MLAAATDRFDLAHEGTPLGQRAGLIQNDFADQAEALKCLAGAHEDALLGSFSGAAHNRKRRGNTHCARISHHQNAEAREHRALYYAATVETGLAG
jgi:hypothetical protein